MPKGYGKGPRKFEDLLSPTPLDDKFVKEMEDEAKNEPGRKSEIEFLKAIKGSDVYDCESGKLYDFITKNGKQKKVFESYTHRKGGKIDLYSIWEYDGMTFGVTIDPFGGYASVSGKKSDLKKIWDEASKTNPEFYDDLNTIKEQLFDAPDEIKRSFNTLVQYFDDQYIVMMHCYTGEHKIIKSDAESEYNRPWTRVYKGTKDKCKSYIKDHVY